MPSWGQGRKETPRVLWSHGTWREGLLKKGHWGMEEGTRIDEDSEAMCWSAREVSRRGWNTRQSRKLWGELNRCKGPGGVREACVAPSPPGSAVSLPSAAFLAQLSVPLT